MNKKEKLKRRSLLFDSDDCPKYFACYDHYTTDVAVFDSAVDRDRWLKADSFFNRISLCLVDVIGIVGMYPKHEYDYDDILWLMNPINV